MIFLPGRFLSLNYSRGWERLPNAQLPASKEGCQGREILLDPNSHRVLRGTDKIQLTPSESHLLEFLMSKNGSAAPHRSTARMSMMGLAARPGTDVEPTCSTSKRELPIAAVCLASSGAKSSNTWPVSPWPDNRKIAEGSRQAPCACSTPAPNPTSNTEQSRWDEVDLACRG
jgi:hypothetical protein